MSRADKGVSVADRNADSAILATSAVSWQKVRNQSEDGDGCCVLSPLSCRVKPPGPPASAARLMTDADFRSAVEAAVRRHIESADAIADLRRLSGGASQESWSLDVLRADGTRLELVLRRAPGGVGTKREEAVPLETEAQVLDMAAKAGVPVPNVFFVLDPEDRLGSGYAMNRIAGETIARKILRDPEFADARKVLARQCGAALARIHSIPLEQASALPELSVGGSLRHWRKVYEEFGDPHPVFEFAFRWLEDHRPEEAPLRVVHGDFRNGNLIVGPDGLRAVLDWEMPHFGDPAEDLAWICVPSWRFGAVDNPVGGFGTYEDLFEGYENASGIPIDPDRVRFWEIFGTLKWGLMCKRICAPHVEGIDRSVERAAVGRRPSETEIDLLMTLT